MQLSAVAVYTQNTHKHTCIHQRNINTSLHTFNTGSNTLSCQVCVCGLCAAFTAPPHLTTYGNNIGKNENHRARVTQCLFDRNRKRHARLLRCFFFFFSFFLGSFSPFDEKHSRLLRCLIYLVHSLRKPAGNFLAFYLCVSRCLLCVAKVKD